MQEFHFKSFIQKIAKGFIEDDLLTHAAAVSFYLALSLSPFLWLLLSVLVALDPALQDQLAVQVQALFGSQASAMITTLIHNVQHLREEISLVGFVTIFALLISASVVFGQLKYSLDRIVKCTDGNAPAPLAKQTGAQLVWRFLRFRILNAGMVLIFISIVIVSLVASSTLNLMVLNFPGAHSELLRLGNGVFQFLVFMLFFMGFFYFTPRRHIGGRPALIAGFVTAILFSLGKYAIGRYLASSAITSTFGAAGSLLALLFWVYYSSLILFTGAEMAKELQNLREEPATN